MRLIALFLTSLLFTTVLVLHIGQGKPKDQNFLKDSTEPAFSKRVEAKTPTGIHLFADQTKVVGWISGSRSFANNKVAIKQGEKQSLVEVTNENTFAIDYVINEPTTMEVSIDKLKKLIKLYPREKHSPTAFFVTDRPVYRHGQTMHFVVFLRSLDDRGQFTPIVNQQVEVQLTSDDEPDHIIKTFELTSDAHGRVSDKFAFDEELQLDDYVLTTKGYQGQKEFELLAYRKEKVYCKIHTEIVGEKLKVKVEGKDFLDRPIDLQKVSLNVKINDKPREKRSRGPEQFAGHLMPGIDFRSVDLSKDEELLWDAGVGTYFLSSWGLWNNYLIAQTSREKQLNNQSQAEFEIPLKQDWFLDDFSLTVTANIVDQFSGRSHAAAKTIPLTTKKVKRQLKTLRRFYQVGESIPVELLSDEELSKEPSTLVAMGLWLVEDNQGFGPVFGRGVTPKKDNKKSSGQWKDTGLGNAVRTSLAASPFVKGKASIRLMKPGAYQLVALTPKKDGEQIQTETSIVVRAKADFPGMILNLDHAMLKEGQKLTGRIHSRYQNASALLTIRDEQGLRRWKPMTIKDGILRLNETLPDDMGYAAAVTLHYFDEQGKAQVISKAIHNNQPARKINIQAKHKKRYAPGEKVKVDIELDRKESVALAVSVYDKSLQRFDKSRSATVDNFYLANESGLEQAAWDALRHRLGNVTIGALVKKSGIELPDAAGDLGGGLDFGRAGGDFCVEEKPKKIVYLSHVQTLLNTHGIEERGFNSSVPGEYDPEGWFKEVTYSDQLFDVIKQRMSSGDRLSILLKNDVFLLYSVPPRSSQIRETATLQFSYPHTQNAGMPVFLGGGGFGGGVAGIGGIGGIGGRPAPGGIGGIGGLAGQGGLGGGIIAGIAGFGGGFAGGAPMGEFDGDDPDNVNIQPAPTLRQNFADTAVWRGNIETDNQGRASIEFDLPDTLTRWQVKITAISKTTHVGQTTTELETYKPLMVWPMLPRGFTESDKTTLFAIVTNHNDKEQSIQTSLKLDNGRVLDKETQSIKLKSGESQPVYWKVQIGDYGKVNVQFSAKSEAGQDAATHELPVQRMAIVQSTSRSGLCQKSVTFNVPKDADLSTAKLEINLVPSMAADLLDSIEYLVEYPYGCVEQTMSRFLPSIKVAQTLQKLEMEHPGLKKKLPKYVNAGIGRLLSMRSSQGGWSWYGGNQESLVMTIYVLSGLMEAEKAGYSVGNGKVIPMELQRLQSIMEQDKILPNDRVYCYSAYTQRHPLNDKQWTWLEQQVDGKTLSDIALGYALDITVRAGKKDLTKKILQRLRARAKKEAGQVYWTTADLKLWQDNPFEVTAVVFHALLAHNSKDPLIPGIVQYFQVNKKGGRWRSTKDTSLIIHALCSYLVKHHTDPLKPKATTLSVNAGQKHTIKFEGNHSKRLELTGKQLQAGENRIAFDKGFEGVAYRIVFKHWITDIPTKGVSQGITIERKFYLMDNNQDDFDGPADNRGPELKPGDVVPLGRSIRCEITLPHGQNRSFPYILIRQPRPTGCEVPEADIEFCDVSAVDREARDEVILWHRQETYMGSTFSCDFVPELEGEYRVPPASAELMYHPEVSGFSSMFHFKVKRK